MKRAPSKGRPTRFSPDEILSAYDFSRSAPNKFAARYTAGSKVVVLQPDVAAAFPTSVEVNEALRALAGIIQKNRATSAGSRRRL